MTGKKHTKSYFQMYFLKIVFLNFLNIRKYYYKPQQYLVKPCT